MVSSVNTKLTALCCVVATVALAGCGGHDMGSHEGHDMAAMGQPKGPTDAAFIADMISHHRGAVEMAQLAQKKAEHPELKAMASSIITAQKGEISTMESLRKQAASAPGSPQHMGMSDHTMGMDGDMKELSTAEPFDKAFLEMMIPHHKGAVAMARTQLKQGKLPQLKKLANSIISSQTKEIEQMRAWLEQWYPGN